MGAAAAEGIGGRIATVGVAAAVGRRLGALPGGGAGRTTLGVGNCVVERTGLGGRGVPVGVGFEESGASAMMGRTGLLMELVKGIAQYDF